MQASAIAKVPQSVTNRALHQIDRIICERRKEVRVFVVFGFVFFHKFLNFGTRVRNVKLAQNIRPFHRLPPSLV